MLPAFIITAPARPEVGLGCSDRCFDGCPIREEGRTRGVTGCSELVDALQGDDSESAEFCSDVGFGLALFLRCAIARHNCAGLLLYRGVAFELGFLFGRLMLEHVRVDAEEQLAFGHALSFFESDAIDLSSNARFHVYAVDGFNVADGQNFDGNILGDSSDDANRHSVCSRRVRFGHHAGTRGERETDQESEESQFAVMFHARNTSWRVSPS
jgi:hypothetical protein